MDPIKLVSTEDLNNPMRFDIRDRSVNLEELDVEVTEIELCPSDGDLIVHWKEDEVPFWSQYAVMKAELKEEIQEELEEKEGGTSINGKEWCKERGIPESVFKQVVEELDLVYGTSPLYPYSTIEQ